MRQVVPVDDEKFSVEAPGEIPPNAQSVLNAAELAPSNIVEQGSVAWADLTLEPPQTGTQEGTPTGTPAGTPTEQS